MADFSRLTTTKLMQLRTGLLVRNAAGDAKHLEAVREELAKRNMRNVEKLMQDVFGK